MKQAKRSIATLERQLLILVFVGIVFGVQSAYAVPITFYFTGTITSIRDSIPPYLNSSIVPGGDFSGSYTFESSTPDDYPNDPWGRYTFPASPSLLMILHIGDYTLVAPLNYIDVDNGTGTKDKYHVASGPLTFSDTAPHMYIDCSSLTQNVFDSDTLPTVPPDISLFDSHEFGLTAYEWAVYGQITSITPEPRSLAFLLIGLSIACMRKQY